MAAIALACPPALGQSGAAGAPAVSLAQSLSGPAKAAYTSAQILANNGDFAGAYAKYDQAYALSRDPRLLFDMAVCARSLKRYAPMQALLVRYQREAQSTMSPEDRSDVASALVAIRDLVGTVKLTVTQAGASVAVDGAVAGTTPLADALVVDLGPHVLTVRKAGFEPFEQKLDVAGSNETAVAVTLEVQRQVAQLVVSSEEGATVVVDNQVSGKGRFDGQLSPGVHEVRVTEPGKVTYRAQVELHLGETRTVDVTLESDKHGPVWPWILGGVAAVGAAVGGYFLLKPQDQTEPVPPGKFGAVQLSAWRTP